MAEERSRAKVAVLVSGKGGNLRALLDAGVPVGLVVADRHSAGGLEVARRARVAVAVLEPAAFADHAAHDGCLAGLLAAHGVSLVVLAGYMHVLGEIICAEYHGRMINLHPSLLPLLPGLRTHRRALEGGHAEHGCSVHWVAPEVDAGPLIRQSRVPVLAGDTPASLAARVGEAEHELLPRVVHDILAGREALQ